MVLPIALVISDSRQRQELEYPRKPASKPSYVFIHVAFLIFRILQL